MPASHAVGSDSINYICWRLVILNIETIILVAVWEKPFVFQGSFIITNKQDDAQKFLFFRCECYLEDKMSIQEDFSPHDYQFTHLYCGQAPIVFDKRNSEFEHALYLLKYTLRATLAQMMNRSQHYFTYIDEVAMSSISRQIGEYINSGRNLAKDNDIGFAVSMDFMPSEENGRLAALSLWEINRFSGT